MSFNARDAMKLPAIPPTNLRDLVAMLIDSRFAQLVPSALSDHWLLSITRDLRLCELSSHGLADEFPLGPLLLIMKLAGARSKESGGDEWVPEDAQLKMLALYQHFAERELVSRSLAMAMPHDKSRFTEAVEGALDLPLQ
jgi:hypothetical protein